jgi:replicative DNA helicase
MDDIRQILDKNIKPKKPVSTSAVADYGKLPPQAVELEEAVLGALMLEKDAFTAVSDLLKPEVFYKPNHQKVYHAISELNKEGEPIDILTVTNKLKSLGDLDIIGGPYFIAQLTSRVGSAANIEYHCRILLEKFIKRELIRISSDVTNQAFEESSDVFDVLDFAEQNLFDVSQGNLNRANTRMSDLLHEAIKNIEDKDGDEKSSGVPSGFFELDEVTGGWQPSNLIIVAARPGMGKTAFALALARNAAIDYKKPVAVFSLEMEAVELVNRMISMETGLESDKLRKGKLTQEDWTQLHTNISLLSEAPIFINDTPGLSIMEFRSIARRLKQQNDVSMILIDYLQLMRGTGDSKGLREQEISMISRSLKAISKELRIPIIALAQLSRKVEESTDKRPLLSHLRESGAIEQDADMVCFLYRPEYYKITQDADGNSTAGLAQLIIAKNRHGALRDINLGFIAEQTKFHNLDMAPSVSNYVRKYAPTDDGNDIGVELDKGISPLPKTITVQSKMNEDDDIPF